VAGSAKTPQLDPVVQEALKDVTSRTHPRRQFLPRRAPLALRKLLAPYLTRRGIFQGGPAPMERERSLNDPSARAAAIHTFEHLKHHGYAFEPDLVHSWAVIHRWKTDDALQLSEYASGVLSGKPYHSAPDPIGRQAIDRWRSQAESVRA
jgi:hypothetical protein